MAAFILDCVFGDPQNPLHPVRIIGAAVSLGVRGYKKLQFKRPVPQFISGALLTLAVVCFSFFVTKLFTFLFYRLNFWLGLSVESIVCYFFIAPKALKDESMKVYRALNAGDLPDARRKLSFIVGRDTKNLSVAGVVNAAVETVAENLSDGVIAPMICIFIGGAPLAAAYKAVNTLDSMIGYKNAEYEYFGKFAARLDDAVNFIPARVSALLMIAGCFFTGADARGAARIYARDRNNHKSPNAAQTESVCAGALGICLGGDNYYNGVLVRKPAIGDAKYEPAPGHIKTANRLMYAAAVCAAVLMSAFGAAYAVLRVFGRV